MDELRRMAEHSSERERAAMKCEREVNALYACLLMEDRVGEEFAATVSSLADFGFFVELDAEHVEGLVRADDLGPGHRLAVGALVWPSGRRVQVGQALTVRLAGVNVQRRQMDFDVVAFAGERPSRRRGGAERVEVPARERRPPAKRLEQPRQDRSQQRRGDRKQRGDRKGQEGGRGRDDRRVDQPRTGPRVEDPRRQRGGGTPRPGRAPAAEKAPSSAHPGFDHLRALAEQERRAGKRPSRQGGPNPQVRPGKTPSGRPGSTRPRRRR
jgi:ribonuclease R